jgi:hypothetical protein
MNPDDRGMKDMQRERKNMNEIHRTMLLEERAALIARRGLVNDDPTMGVLEKARERIAIHHRIVEINEALTGRISALPLEECDVCHNLVQPWHICS